MPLTNDDRPFREMVLKALSELSYPTPHFSTLQDVEALLQDQMGRAKAAYDAANLIHENTNFSVTPISTSLTSAVSVLIRASRDLEHLMDLTGVRNVDELTAWVRKRSAPLSAPDGDSEVKWDDCGYAVLNHFRALPTAKQQNLLLRALPALVIHEWDNKESS